jgi:hypothetical protein
MIHNVASLKHTLPWGWIHNSTSKQIPLNGDYLISLTRSTISCHNYSTEQSNGVWHYGRTPQPNRIYAIHATWVLLSYFHYNQHEINNDRYVFISEKADQLPSTHRHLSLNTCEHASWHVNRPSQHVYKCYLKHKSVDKWTDDYTHTHMFHVCWVYFVVVFRCRHKINRKLCPPYRWCTF